MTTRKQNQSKDLNDDLQVPEQELVREEEISSEAIGQETETLMNVAEKLASASQNFSRQREEYQQIRIMQQEMQRLMSQLAQGIERATAASSMERESIVTPQLQYASPVVRSEAVHESRECECECTHPGCCCFDIYLDKVRGIQPQGILEPADSGDTTLPLPTINELEVRLFVSLDNTNIGLLYPSLSTTAGIRVPSILAGGGPGLWLSINQVVGRVCLKKGTSRTVTLRIQGSEIDEGIERPLGFKDEHGEASGSITLDCCTSIIYPPMPIDLSFDQGGIGGAPPGAKTPGTISLAFYARRVCC